MDVKEVCSCCEVVLSLDFLLSVVCLGMTLNLTAVRSLVVAEVVCCVCAGFVQFFVMYLLRSP